MPDNDITGFINTIIEDATNESRKILEKLEQHRSEIINKTVDRLLEDSYHDIQSGVIKIRSEYGRQISGRMSEGKMESFKLCAEYTDKLFSELRQRVNEFTQTPEYICRLRDMAEKTLPIIQDSDVIVELAERDMALFPEIAGTFTHNATPRVGNISIGGMIITRTDSSLRIDISYDLAFNMMYKSFGEHFSFDSDGQYDDPNTTL